MSHSKKVAFLSKYFMKQTKWNYKPKKWGYTRKDPIGSPVSPKVKSYSKKGKKGLKRKSKSEIRKIQDLLWQEARRIADIIYDPHHCYICGKEISGSNKQLSHLIPKSVCGAFLKYDVYRNLKWCCFHCNITLGGNLAEYYRKMLKENGQEYMDKLYQDKQKVVKAHDFFVTLLEQYKGI